MYTVYSKPNCPYCERAKALLTLKSLEYKEIIVDVGQVKDENKEYITVAELKTRIPSAQTVPQILKDEAIIGGFQELKVLLT